MFKNLSGPAVFAAIILGLAVFLLPDGWMRMTGAVVALVGIIAWARVEPRLRDRYDRTRRRFRVSN